MPVLTQKEYDYKKAIKKSLKENDEGSKAPSSILLKEDKVIKKKKDVYEYYLLHPENGVDDLQNFQDVITLEEKEYKRECKGGVIKTKEEVLANFLLKKGYILMEKIKV